VRGQGLENLSSALSVAEDDWATDSTPGPSALERVFSAHYDRIFSVLFRVTGDRTRAEELASDMLWKAYRHSAELKGKPDSWLYRAATNLGIAELRAKARRQRYERAAAEHLHTAADSNTPLDEALRAEKRSRVRTVLASLKPWQAQILILRSSGLSYKELAEALALKPGSVGTMLARAEAQFQKRFLQLHGNEEWS
jgi:RNA polymerase sigma-70 factor, ECF subfamily